MKLRKIIFYNRVAGNTKIVPQKEVDRIFITTSKIGKIDYNGLSCQNLRLGDVIIISVSIRIMGHVF